MEEQDQERQRMMNLERRVHELELKLVRFELGLLNLSAYLSLEEVTIVKQESSADSKLS